MQYRSNAGKNRTNRILLGVGLLLLVGYCTLFYTVFLSPKTSIGESSEQAEVYKEEMAKQDELINELHNKIASLEQKLNTLPIVASSSSDVGGVDSPIRPGVMILGMHRSGTSILGGLMNKMGLNTGGPLIQPGQDNEKGFFERIDVVLQNDYIMAQQQISYGFRCHAYNPLQGIRDIVLKTQDATQKFFNEGKRALAFLNNEQNFPWMLKDPRLCVTFRTWFPFLKFIPAIVFTYRHPMDVAVSLNKRYEHYQIGKGLRMWYVYNRMAIEQSNDLCRIVSSHHKIMTEPRLELDYIYEGLKKCGVAVPHKVSDEGIASFIDPKLQHGKSTIKDTTCSGDLNQILPPKELWDTTDQGHITLYREVMRVYCAFEDRSAFKDKSFKFLGSIRDD